MEPPVRSIFLKRGKDLRLYRYRTAVLVGRWRASEDEALADAVRTGQAAHSEESGDIVWKVRGRIENVLYGPGHPPPEY